MDRRIERPAGHGGHAAIVVDLGFVLNVIEDADERAATLREAWQLCGRLLVVAAQVHVDGRGQKVVEFGDGVLTGRGTFQKFFDQGELRAYIEEQLECDAVPAALGIFYVFKDETLRQQFLANRYRRRPALAQPRKRISELRFEQHRQLLKLFMAAITDPGTDKKRQTSVVSTPHFSARLGTVVALRAPGQAGFEHPSPSETTLPP